jgi:photosystem II stability/assembly factor-like uncharacterized protein
MVAPGKAAQMSFHSSLIVVPTPKLNILWRIGAEGTIERSEDSGGTWTPQQSGVATALTAASAPSESVCWVVGRAGTILRTVDGRHWEKIGSPDALDWIGVIARDASHATVSALPKVRYATTDGGRTWRLQ